MNIFDWIQNITDEEKKRKKNQIFDWGDKFEAHEIIRNEWFILYEKLKESFGIDPITELPLQKWPICK